MWPLTAADTQPDDLVEWAERHGYTAGPAGPATPQAPTVVQQPPPPNPVGEPGTPQRNPVRSFQCSYRPCKPDGTIATFPSRGACNKHERRVHGPMEDRKHGCQVCEKRVKEGVEGAIAWRFNCPRELHRHFDAVHKDDEPTAVCDVCSSTFKHRLDHVDRHKRDVHLIGLPTDGESTASGSTTLMTPSTTTESAGNGFGLLTPPPSSRGRRPSQSALFAGPSSGLQGS